MKRLTYEEPSGIWGIHGEEIADMSDTMYAVASKLLECEETGLTPDDVRTMQGEMEFVRVGKKIGGYEIFGMYGLFGGYCIAQNEKAPDPYVVWKIDDDGCGVHGGRYRSTKEEAVRVFAEYAFGIKLTESEDTE